jgi:hypothetical protein
MGKICYDCATEKVNGVCPNCYPNDIKSPKIEIGLYQKYIVSKTNGKRLDPGFECIVLRIDGGQYVDACRLGVAAFAEAVRPFNKTLANDIEKRLLELNKK